MTIPIATRVHLAPSPDWECWIARPDESAHGISQRRILKDEAVEWSAKGDTDDLKTLVPQWEKANGRV